MNNYYYKLAFAKKLTAMLLIACSYFPPIIFQTTCFVNGFRLLAGTRNGSRGYPCRSAVKWFSSFPCSSQSSYLTTSMKSMSSSIDPSQFKLQLSIPTVEDLVEVGALLATLSKPPDVLFLDGGTCPKIGTKHETKIRN